MKYGRFAALAFVFMFAVGCGGGTSSPSVSVRSILFLAQVKSYGETSDVFIANGDGTNVRQLTQLTANQTALNACFSPDGQTVLYTLYDLPHASATNPQQTLSSIDIYSIYTDGTNSHAFVQDQTLRGYTISPRFNATGTKVVFAGRVFQPAGTPEIIGHPILAGAYTANPDGSGEQRFADIPPEGGGLFIYYDYEGGINISINVDFGLYSYYALTASASAGSPVPSSIMQKTPWWSYNAASNRVVYTANTADSGYKLFISDPQRTHAVPLASAEGVEAPHFSRDGRKIVFTGLNAAGQAGSANVGAVCVVNADGSGLTQFIVQWKLRCFPRFELTAASQIAPLCAYCFALTIEH